MVNINPYAININAGFEVGSSDALDSRHLMTKAQMLAVSDDVMPDICPTWCPEDGQQYIYRKTNDVDLVTGKFRQVKSGVTLFTATSTTTDEQFAEFMGEPIASIEVVSFNENADWANLFNPHGPTTDKLFILKIGDDITYTYVDDDHFVSAIYKQQKQGSIYSVAAKVYKQLLVSDMGTIDDKMVSDKEIVIYNGNDETVYKRGHLYRIVSGNITGTFYKYNNGSHTLWTTNSSLQNGDLVYFSKDSHVFVCGLAEYEDQPGSFYIIEEGQDPEYTFTESDSAGTDTEIQGVYMWEDCAADSNLFVKHYEVLPEASKNIGEVVQFIGATAGEYVNSHFYKATTTTTKYYNFTNGYLTTAEPVVGGIIYEKSGDAFVATAHTVATVTDTENFEDEAETVYTRNATGDETVTGARWVDSSPDNFQYGVMPDATEFAGKVIQYIGTSTEDYTKGHWYQSVYFDTADEYKWEEIDIESDDYEKIDNIPVLVQEEEVTTTYYAFVGQKDSSDFVFYTKTLILADGVTVYNSSKQEIDTIIDGSVADSYNLNTNTLDADFTIADRDSAQDITETTTKLVESVNPKYTQIIPFIELPTASADYTGKILQYCGDETISGFYEGLKKGEYVRCNSNSGSYSWVKYDPTSKIVVFETLPTTWQGGIAGFGNALASVTEGPVVYEKASDKFYRGSLSVSAGVGTWSWTDITDAWVEAVTTLPSCLYEDVQAHRILAYKGADANGLVNGHIYKAGKIARIDGTFYYVPNGTNSIHTETDTLQEGIEVYVATTVDGSTVYIKTILEEPTTGNFVPQGFDAADYTFTQDEVADSGDYLENVIGWVDATDDKNFVKRVASIDDLGTCTIRNYEDGDVAFIVAGNSTIKGKQFVKADLALKEISDSVKYTSYSSGEYYDYYFASDSAIAAGDTVYIVDRDPSFDTKGYKVLIQDVLVESQNDGYLVPSSMTDNSNADISTGTVPTEDASLGKAWQIDWVPCVDTDLTKIQYKFIELPNAEDLYNSKSVAILSSVPNNYSGKLKEGKTYLGKENSASEPQVDLYAWEVVGGNTTCLTESETPAVGDIVYVVSRYNDSFYTQVAGYVSSVNTGASTINVRINNSTISNLARNSGDDATNANVYKYVDANEIPDGLVETVTTLPTPTEYLLNKTFMYVGETTTVEPIYVHGHFYECKQVPESSPAEYEWVEFDTEIDDYDHIENRPLILHRGEDLFNDTVTLDAGDTTTTTISDKVLVADKKYIISVDGVEHSYTALLDSTDDSIKLDASDIGVVITTADGATDSTMVLTNADFSADPAIIVKEENIVEVNPDYEDFFNGITDAASMQEDVTANVEVGGVAVGDTVAQGKTLTEVIKQILVKYFAPTLTMSAEDENGDPIALLRKKHTTLTQPITINATSVKKSENITKTAIQFGGTEVASGTTAEGETVSYVYETDITTDTIFTSTVTDGRTTVDGELKFEFVNPYKIGNSDVASADFTVTELEALTDSLTKKMTSKEATYTASAKYLVFAYDSSYGALTSIKDQNNFENLNAWTRVTITDSNNEEYYAYITANKVTCSNFKYTFKI